MCVEASPPSGCAKTSCGCGGHGRPAPAAAAPDPRVILALKFGESKETCNCSGQACPRHYMALTGLLLGGFLLLHLALNALTPWPEMFQSAVRRNHALGPLLPVLEVGLIFLPLAVHATLGLRTLRREKLKFGVKKHHHGSDLRQWLQRVSAVILLAFILFHVAVMHRWFGGRFNPSAAFASASQAVWQFWHGLPVGHPANLLIAEFYLLGIVAAVYHVANGVATGAEVLGWVPTPAAQQRLWRACMLGAALLLLAGLMAWNALAMK